MTIKLKIIKAVIFFTYFLFLPLGQSLAQGTADGTGSVDPVATSSEAITSSTDIATTTQASVATSSSPVTQASSSSALPPRPNSSVKPVTVVKPLSTSPATVTPTSTPLATENPITSLPLVEFIVGAAGVFFALFGLYKFNTRKKTDKKDKSRCFDIKKIMDEKLEEITDLKGQLKDKVKEVGTDKLKEALEGTPEGRILNLIEVAEAEFNRLKNLFNTCMIDFDPQKPTAIVIHGWPQKEEYFNPSLPTPSNNQWFPWLREQLMSKDILTQTPEMPKAYEPNYEKWKETFEQFKINKNTMLVGHSCGGGFLVRWLSENNKKVGKVVLVAPWLDPEHEIDPDFFRFEIDPNLIKKTSSLAIMYSTDDDADVLASVKILRSKLPTADFQEFTDKGHFLLESMKTKEFPELLANLL